MSEQRPNVLLITVDQWPGNLLGCAGHNVILTPTLDQLARNGVRYSRAYSESPICIPARRTLMTGTSTSAHGDRIFSTIRPMPEGIATLPQTFRDAGYQAYSVGKLHVYPPRDRIGFDDVQLAEEGRPHLGTIDDYETFLADRGYVGQQFAGGMNNNNYLHRPWHLPEECHPTNWATQAMARVIKRRDPTRPSFWYLSYTHPHPPLTPLSSYMDLYRQFETPEALWASWCADPEALPYTLRMGRNFWPMLSEDALREARRAFYALCTHIDHQLRVVLGTLREEGLLDNTIVLFTADHGDMLGDFGLYAKRVHYEGAANVPFILMGLPGDERLPGEGTIDGRLVGLADVMPTLLSLAGIEIPGSVEGHPIHLHRNEFIYGDCLENKGATRMVVGDRCKLIWYPAGNHLQMFDIRNDPCELENIVNKVEYASDQTQLVEELCRRAWGVDREEGWVSDHELVGFDPGEFVVRPDRTWSGQRGLHYPPPPRVGQEEMVGFPQ